MPSLTKCCTRFPHNDFHVLCFVSRFDLLHSEGEAQEDNFGWYTSLSADGSVMAAGAFLNDGVNGENSGHARVFQFRANVGWEQIGEDM